MTLDPRDNEALMREAFEEWCHVENAHFVGAERLWAFAAFCAAWNRRPPVEVTEEMHNIARQKRLAEISPEERADADLEFAYDEIIRNARRALAAALGEGRKG